MAGPAQATQIPGWLAAILALILPAPERQRYQPLAGLDVPFWSFSLGLVEFIGGAGLLVSDGMVSLEQIAHARAAQIMEHDPTFINSTERAVAYGLSGSLNALIWLAQPTTWLLASIPLVGMMRLVAFGTSREPSGELFAWLFVRLGQLVNRRRRAAAEKVRFGPRRPDRLVEEPGGDLVLLTSSQQPEWNEYVTVQIDDRFYKVTGREERRQPGERWNVYAYKLREEPENAVIRRLVFYEPYLG